MKALLLLLALAVLLTTSASAEKAKAIELNSKDGRTITAVIVSVGENSLKIRKDDGKEFEIPFSRLKEDSIEAAKKVVDEGKEKKTDKDEKEEPKPKTLPPIKEDAKHPKRVNLKLMSDDPTYGYTAKNPILVGSKEEFSGPKEEREYLQSLLDAQGEPITFKRLGSGGKSPHGNILDMYEVTTSDGSKVMLWIDMYHPKAAPDKQPAPVGFYKKR